MQKPGVTKCGKMGLQCVRLVDYKVWHNSGLQSVLDYKVWQNGLQSELGITKITKCVRDYKVWRDYKMS